MIGDQTPVLGVLITPSWGLVHRYATQIAACLVIAAAKHYRLVADSAAFLRHQEDAELRLPLCDCHPCANSHDMYSHEVEKATTLRHHQSFQQNFSPGCDDIAICQSTNVVTICGNTAWRCRYWARHSSGRLTVSGLMSFPDGAGAASADVALHCMSLTHRRCPPPPHLHHPRRQPARGWRRHQPPLLPFDHPRRQPARGWRRHQPPPRPLHHPRWQPARG